jgi:hypothetical protein
MSRNVWDTTMRISKMTSSNPVTITERGKRFLRRAEAAIYVTDRFGFPCSRQWLAKLAVIGGGPVFRKAGRYPIYLPEDLDLWAQARIGPEQRSTSDTGRQEDGGDNPDFGRG